MCARTHISQSSGLQRRNKPCRKQGSSCRGCRTTAVHFKWLYDPFPHVRAITNDTLMQVSLLQSARRLKNVLSVMYLSDDYLLELWRTFTNYSAASIATAPLIPIKQQRTRRLKEQLGDTSSQLIHAAVEVKPAALHRLSLGLFIPPAGGKPFHFPSVTRSPLIFAKWLSCGIGEAGELRGDTVGFSYA